MSGDIPGQMRSAIEECYRCLGTRWYYYPSGERLACTTCNGTGWVDLLKPAAFFEEAPELEVHLRFLPGWVAKAAFLAEADLPVLCNNLTLGRRHFAGHGESPLAALEALLGQMGVGL